MRLSLRRALELERLRLGDQRAHREDGDTVPGPRQRNLLTARNEQRILDTRHARLRGAVEVGIQDRDAEAARAQGAREVQRQCALAHTPLAGTHGHEVTHPGKPIGNAGAQSGDLLEDAGPTVADDVVVALHLSDVVYTGRRG